MVMSFIHEILYKCLNCKILFSSDIVELEFVASVINKPRTLNHANVSAVSGFIKPTGQTPCIILKAIPVLTCKDYMKYGGNLYEYSLIIMLHTSTLPLFISICFNFVKCNLQYTYSCIQTK